MQPPVFGMYVKCDMISIVGALRSIKRSHLDCFRASVERRTKVEVMEMFRNTYIPGPWYQVYEYDTAILERYRSIETRYYMRFVYSRYNSTTGNRLG